MLAVYNTGYHVNVNMCMHIFLHISHYMKMNMECKLQVIIFTSNLK